MVSFSCDRCGKDISRCDLRQGRVENLIDGPLTFELCDHCYVTLRAFLQGNAVAAVDPQRYGLAPETPK
jgi:hypothetical protein